MPHGASRRAQSGQVHSTRGAAVFVDIILVILLLALAGLGGWFVIRAFSGRRR
jgi:hypothetical protein